MTKEFEIGLNLVRTVLEQLNSILDMQDKSAIKQTVKAIFNPIVAAAYQVRVGDGPRKEEFLNALISVVKLMRNMEDMEALKVHISELINVTKEIEKELANVGKGDKTS